MEFELLRFRSAGAKCGEIISRLWAGVEKLKHFPLTLAPVACILIFTVLNCSPILHAAGVVSLTDLDLSQMQSSEGPLAGNDGYRSDSGAVLQPGGSLWVDLHGTAEDFRATIEPFPGRSAAAVGVRFSTPNAMRQIVVGPGSMPQNVHLDLKGQNLLVIESLPAESSDDGIKVHLTSSALASSLRRPSAWGGAAPQTWLTSQWSVRIDGRSGGITQLENSSDPLHMEWIRHATSWGTGWIKRGKEVLAWDRPNQIERIGDHAMSAVYSAGGLQIQVERELKEDRRIHETYTFQNTTKEKIGLDEGEIGIDLPLVDNYPGADDCLPARCHVHLWMGGRSAYVNAMRMGGAAPHLGLVLTEGSLAKYSIADRIEQSNDRGQFVVHPPAITLEPGESFTVGWVLFWHRGWDEFFVQAQTIPGFVRLQAERYAVSLGQSVVVTAQGDLRNAKLSVNGMPSSAMTEFKPATSSSAATWRTEIPANALGEQRIELETQFGRTWLRALVTPSPWLLIANRARFIMEHQQVYAPGKPLDGAYLIYDNETEKQVYERDFPDHNAGRERLAMGTLLALYLKHCDDPFFRKELDRSLQAYAGFVGRELQSESGDVHNGVNRSGPVRLYNYPWVAQFYLAMNSADPKPEYLRRALDSCRAYYGRGGDRFYCIGMPVTWLLESLKAAGWDNERTEMLAAFRKHATNLMRIGVHYPKSEVNYEQSIVGPAAQLLLQVYSATGDRRFLEGAREQMKLLELFGGQQPDYHLHDIAIRHWDDYWFGKRRVYGDTFPHYWSTITGCVFNLYASATGNAGYAQRGEGIFENNFALFSPDGRASCAYVYPLTVNGEPGAFFDPWANDQDWALVNWILFSPLAKAPSSG